MFMSLSIVQRIAIEGVFIKADGIDLRFSQDHDGYGTCCHGNQM